MAKNKKSGQKKGTCAGRLFTVLLLLICLAGAGGAAWHFRRQIKDALENLLDAGADKWQKYRNTEKSAAAPAVKPPQVVEPAVPAAAVKPPKPQVTAPPAIVVEPKVKPPVITVKSNYPHLKLGVPGRSDTLIDRPGYALGFQDYHKQPSWVVYRLTREMVSAKAAKRKEDFREDPEIAGGSATLGDYRNSGFDRGHLAPAADMSYSLRTMSDSFYMSNMSPQKPKFNRGIWKNLEEQVRYFAVYESEIYVVTGPVLPEEKTITIGASKVTVPEKYYKVIYDTTPPEKMIGFIVENRDSSRPLMDYAVTVDAVEEATGLDFFSALPEAKQEKLEKNISVSDWKWIRTKKRKK